MAQASAERVLCRQFPQTLLPFLIQFRVTTTTGQGKARFRISAQTDPTFPHILVESHDTLGLVSGAYYFLRKFANCSVSWAGGDNVRAIALPSPKLDAAMQKHVIADRVAQLVKATPSHFIEKYSPHAYRYFFNECTFGYSTVWWKWADWERHLDWLALNGVNLVLASLGQELLWRDTFVEDFGLRAEDMDLFFSGPAFLPWNRMGNLNGYSGPLPVAWMQQQFQLQKRILGRMVELGLHPVLPGFSGFVPSAMQAAYPHAKISKTRGWYGFEPTFALNPTDPLYRDIHRSFLQRQRKAYKIDDAAVKDGDVPTFFSIDPYNEVRPHTNDPQELGQISLAIYETLREVEGQNAVWVMQGWLFVHQADFWRRYCLVSVLQSRRYIV
jgi:alpha-N-acetylglucosaminidase